MRQHQGRGMPRHGLVLIPSARCVDGYTRLLCEGLALRLCVCARARDAVLAHLGQRVPPPNKPARRLPLCREVAPRAPPHRRINLSPLRVLWPNPTIVTTICRVVRSCRCRARQNGCGGQRPAAASAQLLRRASAARPLGEGRLFAPHADRGNQPLAGRENHTKPATSRVGAASSCSTTGHYRNWSWALLRVMTERASTHVCVRVCVPQTSCEQVPAAVRRLCSRRFLLVMCATITLSWVSTTIHTHPKSRMPSIRATEA